MKNSGRYWNEDFAEILRNYNTKFHVKRPFLKSVGITFLEVYVISFILNAISKLFESQFIIGSIHILIILTVISGILEIFKSIRVDKKEIKQLTEFKKEKMKFNLMTNEEISKFYKKNIDSEYIETYLTDKSKERLKYRNDLNDIISYKDSKGNLKFVHFNDLIMSVVLKNIDDKNIELIKEGFFEYHNNFFYSISNLNLGTESTNYHKLVVGLRDSDISKQLRKKTHIPLKLFIKDYYRFTEKTASELLKESSIFNGTYVSTVTNINKVSYGEALYLLMRSATKYARGIDDDLAQSVQNSLDSVEELVSSEINFLQQMLDLGNTANNRFMLEGITSNCENIIRTMDELTKSIELYNYNINNSMVEQYNNLVIQLDVYKELFNTASEYLKNKDKDKDKE